MDSDNRRIQIRVTDDSLEAWIGVQEGPSLEREALTSMLEAAGIGAGVDEEAIDGIASALTLESAMMQDRCVARGLAPKPGTPPELQLAVEAGLISGTVREDGGLDYRERQLIVPVEKSDVLGHIVPGIEGKPGWDVRGEAIEPEPLEELSVKHGEGIEIDEDGNLIALRTGVRTIDTNDAIDVVELHVHGGAVDLKSGNLRTRGSLEVSRDVTAEMSVYAENDLKIGGSVDGANVEAGGSIEIGGGAIGRHSGSVCSGGDLFVRHALGIRLFARGRIVVARSVSTSNLVAREIEIGGSMLSDSLQAETRIILKDAGSPAGGPCTLRVAHPLDSSDSCKDVENGETGSTAGRDTAPLPNRKGRDSRKGRGARPVSKRQLELTARRKWRKRQRELQRTAVIEVHGTARAGCRLDFGVAPLVLERDVAARRFSIDLESDQIVSVEI
ncbi:MAG: hypothetical protein CL908_02570 [Deltaproteobacteria bacterium]|nr:hypothetical protein [Deltaproteobacteria bacterium]